LINVQVYAGVVSLDLRKESRHVTHYALDVHDVAALLVHVAEILQVRSDPAHELLLVGVRNAVVRELGLLLVSRPPGLLRLLLVVPVLLLGSLLLQVPLLLAVVVPQVHFFLVVEVVLLVKLGTRILVMVLVRLLLLELVVLFVVGLVF